MDHPSKVYVLGNTDVTTDASKPTQKGFKEKLNRLTHWCVKSYMLLVGVEILVLLPTELANIAPSFCRQENTQLKCLSSSKSMSLLKPLSYQLRSSLSD